MFVIANLLNAIARIIELLTYFLNFYIFIIVARALVSWVNPDPYNPIVQFLTRTTEPLLAPIRYWIVRVFRRDFWMDFSPIVAILLIMVAQAVLESFVIATLMELAVRLK